MIYRKEACKSCNSPTLVSSLEVTGGVCRSCYNKIFGKGWQQSFFPASSYEYQGLTITAEGTGNVFTITNVKHSECSEGDEFHLLLNRTLNMVGGSFYIESSSDNLNHLNALLASEVVEFSNEGKLCQITNVFPVNKYVEFEINSTKIS